MSAIVTWTWHQWKHYYGSLFPTTLHDHMIGPGMIFRHVPKSMRDIFVLRVRWGDASDDPDEPAIVLDAQAVFSQRRANTFCRAIQNAFPTASLDDGRRGDVFDILNHWGRRPDGTVVRFTDEHLQNIMEAVLDYTGEIMHSNYTASTAIPNIVLRLQCLVIWAESLLCMVWRDNCKLKSFRFIDMLDHLDMALLKLSFPEAPINDRCWKPHDEGGVIRRKMHRHVCLFKLLVSYAETIDKEWVIDEDGSFQCALHDLGQDVIKARDCVGTPPVPETESDDKYRAAGPLVCHVRYRHYILRSIHALLLVLHAGRIVSNRAALARVAYGLRRMATQDGLAGREEEHYWRATFESFV
jgi:hypothetical protein